MRKPRHVFERWSDKLSRLHLRHWVHWYRNRDRRWSDTCGLHRLVCTRATGLQSSNPESPLYIPRPHLPIRFYLLASQACSAYVIIFQDICSANSKRNINLLIRLLSDDLSFFTDCSHGVQLQQNQWALQNLAFVLFDKRYSFIVWCDVIIAHSRSPRALRTHAKHLPACTTTTTNY